MHLILTGATGLVGSACLHTMLVTESVTKISILSRRPVPMAEGKPKADVIIHEDFSKYSPELLEKLKDAEGVVWALGISYTQVTPEEYEKITVEYPLAAAKAFSTLPSKPFKFVYVSGEGATTEPGWLSSKIVAFGPVKGRAEAALLQLSKSNPGFTPYSLRPGAVDQSQHSEILSYIPTPGLVKATFDKTLGPVFSKLLPSKMSPTAPLSKVLVELAMSNGKPLTGDGISGEGRTISNAGMRRIAGI